MRSCLRQLSPNPDVEAKSDMSFRHVTEYGIEPTIQEAQHIARDARLDILRTLWRLYGYEIRLIDGWYPEARITIAQFAADGHADLDTQLHGHWRDGVPEWTAALKANKNVYDL